MRWLVANPPRSTTPRTVRSCASPRLLGPTMEQHGPRGMHDPRVRGEPRSADPPGERGGPAPFARARDRLDVSLGLVVLPGPETDREVDRPDDDAGQSLDRGDLLDVRDRL